LTEPRHAADHPIAILVNPRSTAAHPGITEYATRRLEPFGLQAVLTTRQRGHAAELARLAMRDHDALTVVTLGGDGTAAEAAGALVDTGAALAPMPTGSTNVFARTIGLPNDPAAAAELLLAGLDDPDSNIRPIGLGRVNGRFFCFHTGVGFDAAVVRTVEQRAHLKRWAGHPLFIWAALRTWLSFYDRRQPHFRLSADGAIGGHGTDPTPADRSRFVPDGFFTVVLNTNPYTFLGNRPLDLGPAAGLDRPLVAVTFRTMSARTILGTLAGALRGGGVKPGPQVSVIDEIHELVIENDVSFPYQVDGDYLGETTLLDFRHVPEAVRLLFPG